MMFKNIYLDRFNSKCHLWKTDGSYDVFDFKCRSFIETPDVPGCQYKTIKGVPVSPYYCSPNDERNRLNSGILNAESDVTLEIRVLSEYFEQTKDLSFKLEQFNIAYVDIETDVGSVFSGPDTVEQRINAITIFCTRSNKFVTFGLERDFVEHVYLTDEDMASGQFADGDEIVNEIDDEGRVTPVTKYYKIVPKKIVFTSKLAQKLNYTHEYVKCDTEKILLQKFFQHFSDNKIDCVSGWNSSRFDLPYLINRSIKLGLNDYRKMSPVNRVYNIEKINDFKQKELHGVICGVSCLDMLEVFKKANLKQQESYKLGDVAQKELGTTKVDLGRHGLTLYRQGQNGFARHIEYNVTDVELLPQLEDKKHYLESLIAVAADARIPLQDFFVSKRVVLGFMLNYMHRKGLVIPNIGEQMSIPYEGAYICANPKHYKWGVSFDFKSLYPSIIASANISPETKLLADEEPRGPYSKSPIKGVYYDNSVLGIIPEIVTVLVEDRDKFKALQKKHSNPSVVEHYDPDLADYYKKKQEAYKIYANSIYGLLGNRYFQFFDVDNAASITGIGRYLIQYCIDYAIKWFDNALPTSEKFKEEFGEYANVTIKGLLDQNYINGVTDKTSLGKYKRLILAHTDSFFFDYSDIYSPFYRRKRTREEFDKLREKYCTEGSPTYDGPLATILNARDATGDWDEMTLTEFTLRFEICAFSRVRALIIDKWVKENNYRTNKLYLKLEKCCNHLIEMGPAHYICYLQYDEGDDLLHSDFEKRFKPVGVEIVKSDTPKWSKTKIKEVLKKVFDDEDKGSIISLLSEYRADFKNPENIHLISKAISINSLQPSANGVLPAPRKGALKYNEIIGYSDDHNGYETISEGTKAKWIYVKEPNRFDTNVITYNTEKYPEFLNKYLQIDYNTQFEKVFQKTLSKIFECIGWGNIFEGDMDVLKKYTRKRNPN